MKLSQYGKLAKLVSKHNALRRAIDEANNFMINTEETNQNCCSFSRYPDGSGASINMMECGVAHKVGAKIESVLVEELVLVEEQMKELGVEVDENGN